MTEKYVAPVRLAFRTEDGWINCYVAKSESMEGAIKLASIRSSVGAHEDIFNAWKGLLTEVMSRVIETELGIPVHHYEDQEAKYDH